MAHHLVELLYQSWADLDHATAGLSAAGAEQQCQGLSPIAWTLGHVSQQVDSWFNVRFAGGTPHPLLGQPIFHTGASGDAPPWSEVLVAVAEVRGSARSFLDAATPADLDLVVPYTGGIDYLAGSGLKLSYALMRTATHHFEHTGEVLTIRSLLGHPVEDTWVWGERLL